jgi:hypothetical protein
VWELGGDSAGCLKTAAVFLLLMAPVYYLLRLFVKLVRYAYGFDDLPGDEGPPLRVCGSCHNTVLEPEFEHCPYCGAQLPAAEPSPKGATHDG